MRIAPATGKNAFEISERQTEERSRNMSQHAFEALRCQNVCDCVHGVIVAVDGTQTRSKMSSMGTPQFDAVDGILECPLRIWRNAAPASAVCFCMKTETGAYSEYRGSTTNT